MPRKAREKSSQKTYHVMLRGINRQKIFYEEEDFKHFEAVIRRYKIKLGFEVLAYCIMGNHVHLLIREGDEPIGTIFRHVGSSFVYWYNLKYQRIGHLFQDRFRSEPVNDEAYLITVFRYILNNPVKAGLCTRAEDYIHSSAREYLLGIEGITDKELICSVFKDKNMKEYICGENSDKCLDVDEEVKAKCTDEVANRLILREFGNDMPVIGKTTNHTVLDMSIRKLSAAGVSIRQLNRLTGLSRKMMRNALEQIG